MIGVCASTPAYKLRDRKGNTPVLFPGGVRNRYSKEATSFVA